MNINHYIVLARDSICELCDKVTSELKSDFYVHKVKDFLKDGSENFLKNTRNSINWQIKKITENVFVSIESEVKELNAVWDILYSLKPDQEVSSDFLEKITALKDQIITVQEKAELDSKEQVRDHILQIANELVQRGELNQKKRSDSNALISKQF